MILYFRSYLITLGMLMAGGGAFALAVARAGEAQPGLFVSGIAVAFVLAGLALVSVGVFSRAATVERWADRASTHEASLIVSVIALPLFMALKLARRKGETRPVSPHVASDRPGKRARRRRTADIQ